MIKAETDFNKWFNGAIQTAKIPCENLPEWVLYDGPDHIQTYSCTQHVSELITDGTVSVLHSMRTDKKCSRYREEWQLEGDPAKVKRIRKFLADFGPTNWQQRVGITIRSGDAAILFNADHTIEIVRIEPEVEGPHLSQHSEEEQIGEIDND